MKSKMKSRKTSIKSLVHLFGIDIVRYKPENYPADFSEKNINLINKVKPYTMTSPERLNSLIEAVNYVVSNDIQGAMVECGVWKGGSSMAMALTLKELGDESREIYLYDTFSGMSSPTDLDISIKGNSAHEKFAETKISSEASEWCFCSLEEVKKNLVDTGYCRENIHFVKGKVEDTIPKSIPKEISLLRLDTDWYESTKHELTHLFPRLQKNGILIIDDYGHWEGARKAVDEYISENNFCILLNRIDYTGRIAIKVD